MNHGRLQAGKLQFHDDSKGALTVCLKGYMTVEASLVMPIVLMLCFLILLTAFFLYNRCAVSQDLYLLSFRGSRLTYAEENYGEVIYSIAKDAEVDTAYLTERLSDRQGYYPFFHSTDYGVHTGEAVTLYASGYGGTLAMQKKAERINIMQLSAESRSANGK